MDTVAPPRWSGLTRIIHERLQPSRGSFPPDTSSGLLCDAPGIAVVSLPRPDEKSLAGTRCTSTARKVSALTRSSLNEMHVFRLGVRELSGLTPRATAAVFFLFLIGSGAAAPATRLVVSECPRCSFVPPLCPTRFCLDPSTVAESAFPLTIAAIDAADLVDAGYTGTVVFSSSDSSATLPPPFSFAPEDTGVAVVTGFVLTQAGSQTITATDAGDPTVSGTLRISVAAALAPIPTTSGVASVAMAGALAILGLWLSWRCSPGN
jgi:hypothetical protein